MSQLNAEVNIKEIPVWSLAYVRHVGPYAGNQELFENLFGQIFQWAGARNLIRFPETKAITVYHDHPETTPEDEQRISVGITVPSTAEVDGDVAKMEIGGGKFAVAKFEINPDQYTEAWKAVYDEWLPQSDYKPDNRACFENYLNDPKTHPEGKHIIEIYVPVIPK